MISIKERVEVLCSESGMWSWFFFFEPVISALGGAAFSPGGSVFRGHWRDGFLGFLGFLAFWGLWRLLSVLEFAKRDWGVGL
jgi:hypothetical protein